jgi:hypothetical protein
LVSSVRRKNGVVFSCANQYEHNLICCSNLFSSSAAEPLKKHKHGGDRFLGYKISDALLPFHTVNEQYKAATLEMSAFFSSH